eukprot:534934_1
MIRRVISVQNADEMDEKAQVSSECCATLAVLNEEVVTRYLMETVDACYGADVRRILNALWISINPVYEIIKYAQIKAIIIRWNGNHDRTDCHSMPSTHIIHNYHSSLHVNNANRFERSHTCLMKRMNTNTKTEAKSSVPTSKRNRGKSIKSQGMMIYL